jgi:beta-galactosidase
LFFNDKSIGTFDIDHKKGKKLLGEYQIPYRKGTLKALAYDENGIVIAEEKKCSFGDAVKIILKPDKTELTADGRDLIFVEISASDEHGIPVENAVNRIEVSVNGAGRLVGMDNGDSSDYDQYKGTSRRLFSGKLLAVIAAKLDPGEILLKASSPGMETQSLSLKALACRKPEGISAYMENSISESKIEIPVRKISLKSSQGNKFNVNLKEIRILAEILPVNAAYQDVEWRAADDAGIDSNLALVKAVGKEAVITALSDGCFRLRCMSRNGSDKTRLISQMEFEITGLGCAYLNPYQFISCGLYNAGKGEIGNGNERGIATPRESIAHIGFRGIDFGEYGSDEITIPIFVLDSLGFKLEIWEGMPEEDGSQMLANVIYKKPSIWNTYQEETYKLSKRLKGITTLCFVTYRKAHIKGFTFTKLEKAYRQLGANENNGIYGDSFKVLKDSIEEIGNNVTLEFDNMDFGDEGLSSIIIYGRSHIGKNTINIRFNSTDGEILRIAEFPYSEDYIEKEFILEKVTGMRKVSFIFLPGCRFDFKWFRFTK